MTAFRLRGPRILPILTLLAATGCLGESSYSTRVDQAVENKKNEGLLNSSLNPPEQGAYQDLGVDLRTPIGYTRAGQPGVSVQAGEFELAETYKGTDGVSLHVLVRKKQRPADAPSPPSRSASFETDLRNLLGTTFGVDASGIAGVASTEGGVAYKKLEFAAPAGNTVSAYLNDSPNTELALIWDRPASAAAPPAMPLTLSSLSTR